MRLMGYGQSALVVLAVLLMHGGAFGIRCYDPNDCRWGSCTTMSSTCNDDEIDIGESRNDGCWNSYLGLGEEDRCCRKVPNCRCGACPQYRATRPCD